MRENLTSAFTETFGSLPSGAVAVASPGRVNLIGEHTDYNDGFVLPIALERSVHLFGAPNDRRQIRVRSLTFDSTCEIPLDALADGFSQPWAGYTLGVAATLRNAGYDFPGFDAVVASDVPLGAGLSSSAAVEVAFGLFMNEAFGLGIPRRKLAGLCQKAEHDYAGVNCGIMDQYTALFGKEGSALVLDCRKLVHEYVPLARAGYSFVVIDSGVRHELAESEYNKRRAGCFEAARKISSISPGVKALRDVSADMLDGARGMLTDEEYRLARHVTSENARVLRAVEVLKAGDAERFGELMFASHESLRDDYRVSCAELDELVEAARAEDGVMGARMTGGGFGGATVNLVRADSAREIAEHIVGHYERAMSIKAEFYVVTAGAGARACAVS